MYVAEYWEPSGSLQEYVLFSTEDKAWEFVNKYPKPDRNHWDVVIRPVD